MPPDQRPPSAGPVADRVLQLLASGRIEVQGRMPWSSNGTYLVTVTDDEETTVAIYKPRRAERPLWDFPDGLYRREVAAYELAEALGWHFVPETVSRADGPLDAGSVQRFVDADFEQHYFTLLEVEAPERPQADGHLRRHRQQRRPQRWSLPAGRRRPAVGHRPRALLPCRAQAAHRHLGFRRGTAPGVGPARPAAARRTRPAGLAHEPAAPRRAASPRGACWPAAGHGASARARHGHHYPWPLV